MTTIRNVITGPGGTPAAGETVVITAVGDPHAKVEVFTSTGGIIGERVLTTDSDGEWSVDLVPTADLIPEGAVYRVEERHGRTKVVNFFTVPDSGSHLLQSVVVDPPGALPSPALNEEIAAREAADAALQAALTSEASTRASADSDLQSAILDEAAAREAADLAIINSLSGYVSASALTAEQTARVDADAALQDGLDDETNRAQGVEATLQADLAAEVTRAQAAEVANAAALTAHLNDTTDAHHASAVGFTPTGSISSTDAQAAIAEVAAEAATALASEVTARAAADTALSSQLSTETTNRTNADSDLQDGLDAEVARALAAEGDITSDLADEVAAALHAANNLSDLLNAATARGNLGLGTAATHPASDFALAADKGASNGYAPLVGGVVPSSYIPAVALVTVQPVADQAARLALTGVQQGDVAVQSDTGVAYMLGSGSPTLDASWFPLAADATISSVNGQTGVVVLDASDVGADASGAAAAAQAASLQRTSNLSDLASAATARGNLGLGTAATHAAGDFETAGAAATLAATLGTAATKNVGTTAGTVAAGDDARLMYALTTIQHKTANYTAAARELVLADANAGGFTVTLPTAPTAGTLIGIQKVDGTGNTVTLAPGGSDTIPGTTGLFKFGELVVLLYDGAAWRDVSGNMTPIWYSTFLAKDNNLSDLANVGTARTNLGLGTAATHAAGDFAAVASNLSDLANAATARGNLGLGSIATHASTEYLALSLLTAANQVLIATGAATPDVLALSASTVLGRKATGGLAALTASDLSTILSLGTAAAHAASDFLQSANNLSDLGNATTARGNLGLGGAATLNVGTTTGTVAAGDDSRITGAAQKASNLSDLANAATARGNLGLGGAATLNVGTAAGTVAAGDDSRLALAASGGLTVVTKTSNYTAAAGELVRDNNGSGGMTVTLPTSPAAGTLVGVAPVGNNLTGVQRGGTNTIEGSTSSLSIRGGGRVILQFDGTSNWVIRDRYIPTTPVFGSTLGIGVTGAFALDCLSPHIFSGEWFLTDAATIATDCSKANAGGVTLGGNRTLGAPTNPTTGQHYYWRFIQDATGNRTITLNAIFKVPSSIGSITLSTAANAVDIMEAYYDGSVWRVLQFVKGYSS